MDTTYYTYVHKRATTGEPFYYGRGKANRAFDPERNRWYAFVVKKHGRIVEILSTGLTEDKSRVEEVRLIAEARTRGENIVNQTEGGDGISGEAARRVGRAHKRNKTSIFAPGIAAKGGKSATEIQRKKGTGIYGMSKEQHIQIGLEAVKNKTGIHHPDFDRRAASLIGANMPWWVDTKTGKHTRSYSKPSEFHVETCVPAAKMPWWVDKVTGKSKRSFECPGETYIKGRKLPLSRR